MTAALNLQYDKILYCNPIVLESAASLNKQQIKEQNWNTFIGIIEIARYN